MAIPALRSARIQRLLQRVQRPWSRMVARRVLERNDVLAGRLLAELARTGQGEFGSDTPRVVSSLLTRSDVAVMLVADTPSDAVTRVLKLPLSAEAVQSTATHRQVVSTLHSMPMLRSFVALIPRALAWGDFEGQHFYLETALGGRIASDLVRQGTAPAMFKQDAVRAIRQLHIGTAQRRVVDSVGFARLAGDDLARLYEESKHWPDSARMRDALQSVEALLRRKFLGLTLPFAWTHGDYWPGNILVHAGGGVSGIIDWDRAIPNQLPLLDVLHLLAYLRKMQQRTELGDQIVEYLLPAAFDRQEQVLVDETLEHYGLPADRDFWHAATLLYWLRFTTANIVRYQRLQSDTFWLSKNVFTVLKRGLP